MSSNLTGTKTTYTALLGAAVHQMRKDKHIEQLEVADQLGVTQASYSRLESGKSVINIDQLFVISKALNTNVSEIIALTEGYLKQIDSLGTKVTAQSLINKKIAEGGGKSKPSNGGAIIAGAALAGILMALISS